MVISYRIPNGHMRIEAGVFFVEINSNAVCTIARANKGLSKRIEELELENEHLRMRIAEILDILDRLDQEDMDGHEVISELRRLLVD